MVELYHQKIMSKLKLNTVSKYSFTKFYFPFDRHGSWEKHNLGRSRTCVIPMVSQPRLGVSVGWYEMGSQGYSHYWSHDHLPLPPRNSEVPRDFSWTKFYGQYIYNFTCCVNENGLVSIMYFPCDADAGSNIIFERINERCKHTFVFGLSPHHKSIYSKSGRNWTKLLCPLDDFGAHTVPPC